MKKDITNNIKIIMIILLMIEMSVVFLSYLLKINLTIISTLAMLVGVMLYAYVRSDMEEEDIDTTFKVMGSQCIFGVYGLSFGLFYNTLYKSVLEMSSENEMLSGMYSSMAGASMFLSIIVNVVFTFFVVVYLKNEDRREKMLLLKNLSFTKLKDSNQADSNEPDIKLCVDKETGKDVIWPHKDRYVHMLCLGRVTRCYMKSITTRISSLKNS